MQSKNDTGCYLTIEIKEPTFLHVIQIPFFVYRRKSNIGNRPIINFMVNMILIVYFVRLNKRSIVRYK